MRHHGDEGGVFDVERTVENTPDGPSPAAPFCYCSSLLIRSVIVVLKMKAPKSAHPKSSAASSWFSSADSQRLRMLIFTNFWRSWAEAS